MGRLSSLFPVNASPTTGLEAEWDGMIGQLKVNATGPPGGYSKISYTQLFSITSILVKLVFQTVCSDPSKVFFANTPSVVYVVQWLLFV